MRFETPSDKIPCAICGHLKEIHMQVCGDRDCECLCFLPSNEIQAPFFLGEVTWQETVLTAVCDLVLYDKEGEIHIKTKDGRECHVRVMFVESVPMIEKVN